MQEIRIFPPGDPRAANLIGGLVHEMQDSARIIDVIRTLGRERDAPGGPTEKGHAKRALQLGDMAGDGRLADALFAGHG
ncbi:hypothetical protein PIB19_06930 [Sphingomonas sp. 7/4-4]|uniref:hypothetical protein n=1 Tax=Sphingomonas sp. 7/4-4 TaxID=3018446 RepID=UPI0022F3D8FF|nr:hypothetical protein [Sphingomonas sp. 7/4-4]WBY09990.1 hypothetical protein PIB19_06930 [Sphingomonas sp. 7/4-4]